MFQSWQSVKPKCILILKYSSYSSVRSILHPHRLSSFYVSRTIPNHLKISPYRSSLQSPSSPILSSLRLFHTKHGKSYTGIHRIHQVQPNLVSPQEAYAWEITQFLKQQGKSNWRYTFVTIITTGMLLFFYLAGMAEGRLHIPFLKRWSRSTWEIATNVNVTFNDVKGCKESVAELQHIVEFLRNPKKFTDVGAKLPKGVLLVGPSGVGKTLLAKAVAGEAHVPFFHASGSQFDNMFVGSGASALSRLFQEAKRHTPCVIFIDEFDAVAGKRVKTTLNPDANQTINQLLSEMDGFNSSTGIIVLAATNRKEHLDPAVLRAGRFDVQIGIWLPNIVDRKALFEHYLKKVQFNCVKNSEEILQLARGTANFTGADIANMVNQAALRAASLNRKEVTMDDLWAIRDIVLMGLPRKRIPDAQLNEHVAIQEAGNAVVALYTPDSTPLHKVTIIRRSEHLGHTSHIPETDILNRTKSQLQADIDVQMGARVAEELFLGSNQVSNKPKDAFLKATAYAERIVMDYSMSSKFGFRVVDERNPDFLSPSTSEIINKEVDLLLRNSYERARHILTTHSKEHRLLVEALLKYETLDAEDIRTVIEGRKPKVAALLENVEVNS